MRQKRKNIHLVLAVYQNKEKRVSELLAEGACPKYVCSSADEGGIFASKTALQVALESKHPEIAMLLLREDTLMHTVASGRYEGFSMLMLAMSYCPSVVCSMVGLIEDINHVVKSGSMKGCSVLAIACIKKHTETAALMVKKGATFNKEEVLKLAKHNLVNRDFLPTLGEEYAKSIIYCFPKLREKIYLLLVCLKRNKLFIHRYIWGHIIAEHLLPHTYPPASHNGNQRLAYEKKLALRNMLDESVEQLALMHYPKL